MGTAALVAATLISALGVASFAARLLMGAASDRIGNLNTLIVSCLLMAPSLILLIFAKELWMFYLFAIIYGFGYGAEAPQQGALPSKYFGNQVILVSIMMLGADLGAALGSWVAGMVFDVTQSYQIAFILAALAIGMALSGTLTLKREERKKIKTEQTASVLTIPESN